MEKLIILQTPISKVEILGPGFVLLAEVSFSLPVSAAAGFELSNLMSLANCPFSCATTAGAPVS
jgi:hypothetical protein